MFLMYDEASCLGLCK
uniref:Uncharacterized protein n=1 Tax=Rhizophora mucronata TaxID=61149 RepID=A0A2P2QI51_RHIMU